MKGFILVTDKEQGRKTCIAINSIKAIDELDDGTAYIIMQETVSYNLKHSGSFGVCTVESFDEVIKLIENSI